MKKRLREIYSTSVISVPPATPVSEALGLMRQQRISCILVQKECVPVGIFTERDTVRCIATRGTSFLGGKIQEVMTRELVSLTSDTFIHEAFNLMVQNSIRHLVVVNGQGETAGVVTQSDLIEHLGYEYFMKVKQISQVMTRTIQTISPRSPLMDAISEMAAKRISFLVVVQDDIPQGVITERDITKLTVDGVDVQDCSIEQVMHAPVITVPLNLTAPKAAKRMKKEGIRRLVVVDAHGRLAGVVTQSDMIKGLESRYVDTLKQIIMDQSSEIDRIIRELSEKTLYLDGILSSSTKTGILATDKTLRILYYNKAAEEILQLPSEKVLGRNIEVVQHQLHLPPERFQKTLSLIGNREVFSFSFEEPSNDGRRFVQVRLSGIQDKESTLGVVVMLQDITEQKLAEETIRHLAYYDVLTNLPNRVLFQERLSREEARCRRHQKSMALLTLDVDHFKEVNDTFGHSAGDELLCQVGERLKSVLREVDTVARIGGDEFTIILPDIQLRENAEQVAGKILHELDSPYQIEGRDLSMRFSLGIALYPDQCEDVEILLQRSDKAMYEAKKKGRSNNGSNVFVYGRP